MAGAFEVLFTARAEASMLRLHAHLLERAETLEELDDADDDVNAVEASIVGSLSRNPLLYRRAGDDPFERELVIPLKRAGYVALYRVVPATRKVYILAVRHQLEGDYR